MGKVKIFWPTVVAVAVAVTLNSCQNEKMKKDYEREQRLNALKIQETQTFTPADFDLDQFKLDKVITVEEYIKMIEDEKNKTEEKKNEDVLENEKVLKKNHRKVH